MKSSIPSWSRFFEDRSDLTHSRQRYFITGQEGVVTIQIFESEESSVILLPSQSTPTNGVT